MRVRVCVCVCVCVFRKRDRDARCVLHMWIILECCWMETLAEMRERSYSTSLFFPRAFFFGILKLLMIFIFLNGKTFIHYFVFCCSFFPIQNCSSAIIRKKTLKLFCINNYSSDFEKLSI